MFVEHPNPVSKFFLSFLLVLIIVSSESRFSPTYRGADKSLARPGRKQARKHVRDTRGFNNMETRAVIKSPPPIQDKAPKQIHAILTETLVCFLPGRVKDLSAILYYIVETGNVRIT